MPLQYVLLQAFSDKIHLNGLFELLNFYERNYRIYSKSKSL